MLSKKANFQALLLIASSLSNGRKFASAFVSGAQHSYKGTTNTFGCTQRYLHVVGRSMSSQQEQNVGVADIGKDKMDKRGKEKSSRYEENCPVGVPWREAIEKSMARSRKIRGSNFVQLATVSAENEPRVRSVVFRGFVSKTGDNSTVMKLITDGRSEKVNEINNQVNNMAELHWWFGKSSEQYRIRCSVKFVGDGEANADHLRWRKEQWGNLSDKAREQFFWRNPGEDFQLQCEVPEGGRDSEGKVLPPPPTFLLVLLYPKRVDYLRLTDNYRQIDSFDNSSEDWCVQRVNP